MTKLKVEGYEHLVRDLESNAIVNTNQTEFQAYITKYKAREQQSDILRNTVKEINTLKAELFEIKNLLQKVINK